jgi:hypothetical protein
MARKRIDPENELDDVVDRMVDLAERLGVPEDVLDDHVMEAGEQAANDANGAGLEAQVRFLLTNGMDEKELKNILETAENGL